MAFTYMCVTFLSCSLLSSCPQNSPDPLLLTRHAPFILSCLCVCVYLIWCVYDVCLCGYDNVYICLVCAFVCVMCICVVRDVCGCVYLCMYDMWLHVYLFLCVYHVFVCVSCACVCVVWYVFIMDGSVYDNVFVFLYVSCVCVCIMCIYVFYVCVWCVCMCVLSGDPMVPLKLLTEKWGRDIQEHGTFPPPTSLRNHPSN